MRTIRTGAKGLSALSVSFVFSGANVPHFTQLREQGMNAYNC